MSHNVRFSVTKNAKSSISFFLVGIAFSRRLFTLRKMGNKGAGVGYKLAESASFFVFDRLSQRLFVVKSGSNVPNHSSYAIFIFHSKTESPYFVFIGRNGGR